MPPGCCQKRFALTAGIFLFSIASTLSAATGSVVDESGKPVTGALIRFVQHNAPGVSAAAVPDVASAADGTFTLPNLTGAAEVCIQVPGSNAGYVNPCLWPSQKLTLSSLSATALAPIQIIVKKGAIATIRVNDPTGVLAANPKQPLIVGVFAPGGMFYPATQKQADKTGRSYSLTVPYGVSASLL